MLTPEQIKELVDKEMSALNLVNTPDTLYEPARYILSLGGKRIRPCLSLMASNIFTDTLSNCTSVALAMELFHNFSLMHDDIMDKATLRRGKQTVHEKYNINTAILSGDALLIKAYELICMASPQLLPSLITMFNTTAIQVCEGQQMDMDFEMQEVVSDSAYIDMITLKTSVLLGCCMYCGAVVAGASTQDAERLYNFGKHIGISFQIQDDILDAYAHQEVFGKKIGGDILNNKKTFLTVNAFNNCSHEDKLHLRTTMKNAHIDDDTKIETVLAIYEKYNARQHAVAEMEKYYAEALHHLKTVSINPERLKNLLTYAEIIYGRTI